MAVAAAHPRRADATPSTPPTSDRRIAPSWGLPSGRAVAGGLLVALAGVGTFAISTGVGDGPGDKMVVARHALAPGTILEPGDLALAQGDLPPSAADGAFSSVAQVAGAVTVGPLAEGDVVQAGSLADGSDAAVPTFSIALAAADADAGTLEGGDVVEVLATYGADASATTVSLSSTARIVGLSGSDDALGTAGQVVVRLAVAAAEERSAIVHAAVTARLTLVRTTGAGPTEIVERFRPPAAPIAAGGVEDGSDP